MKFNHLNVPDHWKQYWSRYPEGFTILEALISWVSQVDNMVDNQNKLNDNVEQFRNEIDEFVERFDERLQDEVTQTLSDWQNSGFLDVVISEALQWELDDFKATTEQNFLSVNQQLQQSPKLSYEKTRIDTWRERFDNQIVNIKDFGAIGDGKTDDTVPIQNAIDYCIENKYNLYIPKGESGNGRYNITKTLLVHGSIAIYGYGRGQTGIVTNSCNAFEITSNNVRFYNFDVNFGPRHTVSPNEFVGIHVAGKQGKMLRGFVFYNISVDGFNTGWKTDYIWSTVFDGCVVVYCKHSLTNYGLSVNNSLINCRFSAMGMGSVVLNLLYDGVNMAQGWMVTNCLLAEAECLIYADTFGSMLLNNNIFDLCKGTNSVKLVNNCNDWEISNNYFAGSKGNGILILDCKDIINNGYKIIGNEFQQYTTGENTVGIRFASPTYSNNSIIANNSFRGFSLNDISIDSPNAPAIITGNACLSNLENNIVALSESLISDNIGNVYWTKNTNVYSMIGRIKVTYGDNPPTTGKWRRGDICYTVNPVAGGVIGYRCVTGGSPGVWKSMGNLES